MARYGYARVSTREQNPDHQIDALLAAGVSGENLFIEKVSGKLSSRVQLDAMLAKLEPGDQVVIAHLRRIGRSHQHLLDLVRGFNDKGVDFIVLEQGIDTTTPGGRLAFHVFAALAEYDRELIVEGTLDGLAAARARGRVGGRPPALSQRQLDQAQTMYDSGKYTVAEIAETLNVGRAPPSTGNWVPTRTVPTAPSLSTATPAPARSTRTPTAVTERPAPVKKLSAKPTGNGSP
ncbi:recombinase family protein [Pseudarthrobacter sp. S9]|uniref:recombinase family protein n=1 Tax=Pseudarthrobacter sp. S9 TaxID=3418421 RepID=UPI003D02FEA8